MRLTGLATNRGQRRPVCRDIESEAGGFVRFYMKGTLLIVRCQPRFATQKPEDSQLSKHSPADRPYLRESTDLITFSVAKNRNLSMHVGL